MEKRCVGLGVETRFDSIVDKGDEGQFATFLNGDFEKTVSYIKLLNSSEQSLIDEFSFLNSTLIIEAKRAIQFRNKNPEP